MSQPQQKLPSHIPMYKTRTRSVLICVCQNKKCQARFEVLGAFQSQRFCKDCMKPAKCIHNVLTTDKCDACKRVHGNFFTRTM